MLHVMLQCVSLPLALPVINFFVTNSLDTQFQQKCGLTTIFSRSGQLIGICTVDTKAPAPHSSVTKSGIKWVNLSLGSVEQYLDKKEVMMLGYL